LIRYCRPNISCLLPTVVNKVATKIHPDYSALALAVSRQYYHSYQTDDQHNSSRNTELKKPWRFALTTATLTVLAVASFSSTFNQSSSDTVDISNDSNKKSKLSSTPSNQNHTISHDNTNSSLASKEVGLVSVSFLPHGTMILDRDRPDLPSTVPELRQAMIEASQLIASSHPDLILVSTPHGFNLCDSMTIYQPSNSNNVIASGTGEWNGEWKNFGVKVHINAPAAQDLLEFMKELQLQQEKHQYKPVFKVEGLAMFGRMSIPLRWGEVVPLYFVLQSLYNQQNQLSESNSNFTLKNIDMTTTPLLSSKPNPTAIFFTPSIGKCCSDSGYQSYKASFPQSHVEFGRSLAHWCDNYGHSHGIKIALVISGDLSHLHYFDREKTPELYHPDTKSGFPLVPSPDSAPALSSKLFDRLLRDWTETLDENIIQQLVPLAPQALSCGFTGALMMHGVLTANKNGRIPSSSTASQQKKWRRKLLHYACPSYFGMMVAVFLKDQ